MTSRTAQKRSRTEDPLERELRGGPRCQCKHSDGRCRRRAKFRVSAICAVEDCGSAVHVYLACATCKDNWLHRASHDPTAPEYRVAPL